MAPAAAFAGAGMLVALIIAAIPLCIFAMNYALMSQVAPASVDCSMRPFFPKRQKTLPKGLLTWTKFFPAASKAASP